MMVRDGDAATESVPWMDGRTPTNANRVTTMVAIARAPHRRVLTLLVDNYDSYTYNIFQMLAEINGVAPVVVQNDAFEGCWTQAWAHFQHHATQLQKQYTNPSDHAGAPLELALNVVISPGPGHPSVREDFGMCADAIRFAEVPVLGVCLGHQGLALVHGGAVVNAPEVMHGRTSCVMCDHSPTLASPSLFTHVPDAFEVVRYHSLVVDPANVPAQLAVTARTDDGVIMAMQHREKPQYGVQFHPEAVCSTFGYQILQNFRDATLGLAPTKCPLEHGDRFPRDVVETDDATVVMPSETTNAAPKYTVLIDRVATGVASLDFAQHVFNELFSAAERSFWLDSSNYVDTRASTTSIEKSAAQGRQPSRFSFMGDGSGPLAHCLEFSVLQKQLRVHQANGPLAVQENADAMAILRDRLTEFQSHETKCIDEANGSTEIPFSFRGGYVGYLGYEMLENGLADESDSSASVLREHLEQKLADREYVPDMSLLFADRVLVFDHQADWLYTVSVSSSDAGGDAAARAWHSSTAARLIELTEGRIEGTLSHSTISEPSDSRVVFRPSRSRDQYMHDIADVQQQIHDGETYEVCLTNQLRAQVSIRDPLAFYEVLRHRNPAPYAAFYLSNPEKHFSFNSAPSSLIQQETTSRNAMETTYAVCCSSPERFLRVENDGWMESKPIKGTRRRGHTVMEDREIIDELASCQKDRAENMMIADLVRNDFGRVAQIGTVYVPKLMKVETYATVHQLVTTVRAKRSSTADVVDVIKATFPGGSMTGAPKKRTMQLIRSLERQPRGVYSGALGFFSLDGSCDLNIIIRTALITKQSVSLGSGGAIVALSDCEDEYDEMLLKTRALVQAIGAFVTGHDDGTGAIVDTSLST